MTIAEITIKGDHLAGLSAGSAAAQITHAKYGMRALSADEGGLAPPFPDSETMLGQTTPPEAALFTEDGRRHPFPAPRSTPLQPKVPNSPVLGGTNGV